MDRGQPRQLPGLGADDVYTVCTIDRRKSIERKEFERYYRERKPLILRGGARNWAAMRGDNAWGDKAAFLSHVGACACVCCRYSVCVRCTES